MAPECVQRMWGTSGTVFTLLASNLHERGSRAFRPPRGGTDHENRAAFAPSRKTDPSGRPAAPHRPRPDRQLPAAAGGHDPQAPVRGAREAPAAPPPALAPAAPAELRPPVDDGDHPP